jgi:hypothetical protein
MIKSTFAIVAFLAIGVTFAYAEESVVQVPFDYHGQSCWLESDTTYQCVWEGEVKPFSLDDLERYAHILTEEQYAEEYAKLTAEPEPEVVVDDRTPEEKLIEKLQLKLYRGEADATEATHLRLLKQLDECQRGLGNSAAVQDRTSFVISEFTHGKYNNIEIKGQIGDLLMAIQECKAQNTLEHYVLSAADGNMANGDEDVFYDHHDAWTGIEALDYELYTKNSKRIDMNGICDNNQYTWSNKIMMGCEDTRVYDGTTHKGTSGKITYFSGTIGEYQKYLNENNRYATTEDKKIQEQIAQPVLQEMLEENRWYDRE